MIFVIIEDCEKTWLMWPQFSCTAAKMILKI